MAPQGLVVLAVPLTAGGQNQRYWYPFSPAADLTNRTVTLRVHAPGATSGSLSVYLSANNSAAGKVAQVPFSELCDGWKDIVLHGGKASGNFDPAQVKQVTIEVKSHGTGPWKKSTVVYIDSLLISDLALGNAFDSSLGGVLQSSIQAVPGSTLTWSSAMP